MSEGHWVKVYQADSRRMPEIEEGSVELIVTSPPYWHIKDYGVEGQIGYGQRLHDYLYDLYHVWEECYRILQPGRRLCVNIGDQFARASVYGRYKVIPLHAEVIAQAEQIGFDYLGAIIWQKRTTMETSGGATVMGSYPYPPNGIVEIDYEYILIFKKPGKSHRMSPELKKASQMTKEEWKMYFSGHWTFGGVRQIRHEAAFPLELPRRLIRMFSFVDETVLDPFAGSGTTLAAALRLERNAIGYEISPAFVKLIEERLLALGKPLLGDRLIFERRDKPPLSPPPPVGYRPMIQDANPPTQEPRQHRDLHRVVGMDGTGVLLDSGVCVELLGVEIVRSDAFEDYARHYLMGKQVFTRDERPLDATGKRIRAYLYLKNRIFVNGYLLKTGMARVTTESHRLRQKFLRWQESRI